jgi:hypothetical protein
MQTAQSLQAFLDGLTRGVDHGAPLRWASAIFIGEVKEAPLKILTGCRQRARR